MSTGDYPFRTKFLLIIGVLLVGMAANMAMSLDTLRDEMMDNRRAETQQLVEVAAGTIGYFVGEAHAGRMSVSEAQAAAVTAVKGLRYADTDYFWINDLSGRMIMHPVRPDLDGQDLYGFQDPAGKRLFVEMIDTVRRQGAGFVGYLWPKPGLDRPVRKLSYVKGIAEWGWLVGSGMYLDDIDAVFWREVLRHCAWVALIVAVAVLVSWWMSRNVVHTIAEITAVMKRLAAGDTSVEITADDRRDEIGAMIRALEVFRTHAQENARLYADLREREARIRRLVDSNIIGVSFWNLSGAITAANDALLQMIGYGTDDLMSGRIRWAEMTAPEYRDADACAIAQLTTTGTCKPFEKEYVRRDGGRVPVLMGAAMFEGSPDEGVSFVLDLTERKQAEEHQRRLIEELNHRVKNTLATVEAIARQTLYTAETPEEFAARFEARLLSLSQTHDLLNQTCWEGVSLRAILEQELAPLTFGDAGRAVLAGEDVHLGPIAAVTLGIAFHELATNAAKYGALSVPTGRIRVAWQAQGSDRIRLDWEETGGPVMVAARRRGFGIRLLEDVLPQELGGDVHVDLGPKGLHCAMLMSRAQIAAH